jgi:GTP-binding protein EngB required for normal cell division
MTRGFVDLFRHFLGRYDDLKEKKVPIELDISIGDNTPTIYAPKATAAILGSVFAETGSDIAIPDADREINGRRARTASNKFQVGKELKSAKDKIEFYGKQISEVSDPAIANYITNILKLFDAQICNIAVLGQMNSGKSTLVNTLIGKLDFLPAEITPWTTVVTNLYFGVPSMPRSGAVFDFFDADEWQRLAEGSTRVRELTERLIPDLDWATFYRQVGDMREKARAKLGPRFEDLLGSQHSFSHVTPGLLQKYVCAEPAIEGTGAAETGQYSVITKAAHLYFDLGGFFYPTLVIDTPGINDPFLVRDEITRQNLERANIFVIVVTARQPLSNADVDLLRILRGLDKDRIIVFVNKIDEVEKFPEFEAAIQGRIKGVLEREFPDARIPIVMGSARWAGRALAAAEGAPLPELPPAMRLSAREIAALGDDGKSFWAQDLSVQEAVAAEEVMSRSGVPALALAVSEMMESGPIADALRFSSVALAAIAANCAASAEAGVEMEAAFRDSFRAGKKLAEGDLAKMRRRLAETDAIAQEIEKVVATSQSRFDDQIETGLSALRKMLRIKLEDYAATMPAPGSDQPEGDKQGRQSVNVMPLRAILEREFSQEFFRIYGRIVDLARAGEARIQDLVRRTKDAGGVAIVYSPLPVLKLAPPLAALGDPIALAAGGTIQAQWRRQQISSEERDARFRALIETQFQAIIDKLCEAAASDMSRASAFIIDHFRMSVLHCLQTSHGARQDSLERYLAAFTKGVSLQARHADAAMKELEKLRAAAATCRRIAAELAVLRP